MLTLGKVRLSKCWFCPAGLGRDQDRAPQGQRPPQGLDQIQAKIPSQIIFNNPRYSIKPGNPPDPQILTNIPYFTGYYDSIHSTDKSSKLLLMPLSCIIMYTILTNPETNKANIFSNYFIIPPPPYKHKNIEYFFRLGARAWGDICRIGL